MKKLSLFFFLAILMGCASTGHQIKAMTSAEEVVEAEGTAPIVKGDLNGAKNAALHDAEKNALGLVIGVYVSQDALVSKALLIEDNITSQTEGYIEKIDVISESHDDNFYKTKIRALVKKEDLSEKLKSLELEPKKLGNPIVYVSIKEFIDGQPYGTTFAENELKGDFTALGYVVSDSTKSADIVVSGKAESNFSTDQGLGGLISYRATLSVQTSKAGSQNVIAANNETVGGVDSTKDAAARAAISNSAKKVGAYLPANVLKSLRERSTVNLTVSNVENINKLNDFIRSVRVIIEVRDCFVRNYSNGVAVVDIDVKKGNASDIAKRLEQLTSFTVKIKSATVFSIDAELVNK